MLRPVRQGNRNMTTWASGRGQVGPGDQGFGKGNRKRHVKMHWRARGPANTNTRRNLLIKTLLHGTGKSMVSGGHAHARMHARAHARSFALQHARTRASMCARTHTCSHARVPMRMHACTHACTHAYMHVNTHERTHARMHARVHAHARAHLGPVLLPPGAMPLKSDRIGAQIAQGRVCCLRLSSL